MMHALAVRAAVSDVVLPLMAKKGKQKSAAKATERFHEFLDPDHAEREESHSTRYVRRGIHDAIARKRGEKVH